MRQRYKSANCRAACASSSFAKLRSLFSMISSCQSVIGAVATRYKESIKESIVFMPSVRSDTHHKMRVRLKFEIGSSTARESAARLARSCEAAERVQKMATEHRRGITPQHNSAFLVRCFTQAEALRLERLRQATSASLAQK